MPRPKKTIPSTPVEMCSGCGQPKVDGHDEYFCRLSREGEPASVAAPAMRPHVVGAAWQPGPLPHAQEETLVDVSRRLLARCPHTEPGHYEGLGEESLCVFLELAFVRMEKLIAELQAQVAS